MAQPVNFRLQYLGSMQVEKNKEYTATQITVAFPNATAFMLKTDVRRDEAIKVSINATPSFPIYLNEITAFDRTTSFTYVFNQDCIIVALQDLDVTL